MATVGRNVAVNTYKIYCKIIDKYKHVYMFSEVSGISYATLTQLFAGKTKSMRAETVVKLAGALECPVSEIVIQTQKPEKKKVDNKAMENLLLLIEELGL